MRFEKKFMTDMPWCYAASHVTIDGEDFAILAGEDRGSSCFAYSGKDFDDCEVVWEAPAPGGVMSIVPIPGRSGELLAVNHFFPIFQSEEARIVWVKREGKGNWTRKDFVSLPFVHRFDILQRNGELYLIGCALCNSKKFTDDWSDPGRVCVGHMPKDLSEGMQLTSIMEGLYKNHGYCRAPYKGVESGYVCTNNGMFVFTPPETPDSEWGVEQIFDRPIGDVAVFDIDGCGEAELITEEPMHGQELSINKLIDGEYKKVYTHEPMEFIHAVWGGMLRGVPTAIVGERRGKCALVCIRCKNAATQEYVSEVIDEGVGPSNIDVLHYEDRDVIISANHTANEGSLYFVYDK